MTISAKATIRALTAEEAEALLARNWIARIAFAAGDRVDVEPINYVYDAPWIFGRTSVGEKLVALGHNSWCALETDEVHGVFDWRSVVVKGPLYALNSSLGYAGDYDRAVAALRRLVPETFTPEDPAPHRTVVFGIRPLEIDGRLSVWKGSLNK